MAYSHEALVHALTEADRRESVKRPQLARLALYMDAADRVREAVKRGEAPEDAFANVFVPTREMHRVARQLELGLDVQRGQWVKKNPGSRWHGRKATEAEEDRIRAERRGSIIGSHFYRGKREAHRESQDESRRMGLNPEHEREGSMGYIEVQDVQALRRAAKPHGIKVRWNADGSVTVRTPSGQVVRAAFNAHIYEIIEAIRSGELNPPHRQNPGAAWHEKEATEERASRARMEVRGKPLAAQYFRGRADAHIHSAHESRKLGLNPRPSAIPAHKLAAANRYVNMIRNKNKRDYGFAYLAWLKGGAVGNEPERPAGLSVMGAQAVMIQLNAMKLWENPRGTRTVVGRVFRAKRWAKRWARGRPVKRVKGGWQVSPGRKRTPAQELVHRRGRENPSSAYDVFLRGKKIDTVFQSDPSSSEEVKRSLVQHDGYDPEIRVVKQRKKQLHKNPIAVYNPPAGRIIYGRVLSVEAQKTNGSYKGKRFRHSFEQDSHVAAYALPDGSVLLKSAAGKRLWQDR